MQNDQTIEVSKAEISLIIQDAIERGLIDVHCETFEKNKSQLFLMLGNVK